MKTMIFSFLLLVLSLSSFSCQKKTENNEDNHQSSNPQPSQVIKNYEINEQIFNSFPADISFFTDNDIKVDIIPEDDSVNTNIDQKNYHNKPIIVNGENFSIMYSTINENVIISDVELFGPSIFDDWNHYFGKKKNDIIMLWGKPYRDVVGRLLYSNDFISIDFEFENNSLSKVHIYYEP